MIYRDPRGMTRHPEYGSIVYLFSDPDPDEIRAWAKEHKIPCGMWDAARKRMAVYGRGKLKALSVEKAPLALFKEVRERWENPSS